MNDAHRIALFGALSAAGQAFQTLGRACEVSAAAFQNPASAPAGQLQLQLVPDPAPTPAVAPAAAPAPAAAAAPVAATAPAPEPAAPAPALEPAAPAAPAPIPGGPTKAGVKDAIQSWIREAAGDKAELGRRGAAVQSIFTAMGAKSMGDLDPKQFTPLLGQVEVLKAGWGVA